MNKFRDPTGSTVSTSTQEAHGEADDPAHIGREARCRRETWGGTAQEMGAPWHLRFTRG